MNRSTFRSMKLCGCIAARRSLAGCPNQGAERFEDRAQRRATRRTAQKQYETAIAEFKKATEQWRDNHLAWYGMGGAYAGKQRLGKAPTRSAHAVQLAPEQPMYQMWYGISLYEKAVAAGARGSGEEREQEARGGPAGSLDGELREADAAPAGGRRSSTPTCGARTTTSADLSRAPTSRRKRRTSSRPAIKSNPRESGPYVALGELYRKWDYTDRRSRSTSQGAVNVPGSNEVSDIWYVLGMGYDDKRHGRQGDRGVQQGDRDRRRTTTRRSSSAARRTSARATSPTPSATSRSSRSRAARRSSSRSSRREDADGHRREVGRRQRAADARRSRRRTSSRRAPRAPPRSTSVTAPTSRAGPTRGRRRAAVIRFRTTQYADRARCALLR